MRNNLSFMRSNFFGFGSDGDFETTGNVSFPSILDGPTVYKYFNNFKINSGHTVTTSNRCKGLVVYCAGDCIIEGTLSMTSRGANVAGQNFKPNGLDNLIKQDLSKLNMSIGVVGGGRNSIGVNGACGGGGDGAGAWYQSSGRVGYGSAGTTFSGGAGAGGVWLAGYGGCPTSRNGNDAGSNGGAGSNGYACEPNSDYSGQAGGGAGNPGGSYAASGGRNYGGTNGGNGTGGLLILIVLGHLQILLTGKVLSNGSNGGNAYTGYHSNCLGGGGSGGGSITILYSKNYINSGSIQVNGGSGGSGNNYGNNGGAGSIRVQKIS